MAAGRPKEFDEGHAVDRAMEVFWRQGYAGASLKDLLRAMGISRQSLYDTFGNKRELFIRVIAHYRVTQLAGALALLDREGSAVENVRAAVRFFEELGRDPECRGCLVANSLVEFGPSGDDEVSKLLRETLVLLQVAIEDALVRAQLAGELSMTKSPPQLSRALTNAMVGMAVTGRLRISQGDLGDVYVGTLSMLD